MEKGDNIFGVGNASTIPSSRQTEQATTCGAAVTIETLIALLVQLKVPLTMCRENVCWEIIPIWKSIKSQERQKARKETESNLSKG